MMPAIALQTVPAVALQMIPTICGNMLAITLSGGFAPPAAWQTPQYFSWRSARLKGGTVSGTF